jgi:hypothetical protein
MGDVVNPKVDVELSYVKHRISANEAGGLGKSIVFVIVI